MVHRWSRRTVFFIHQRDAFWKGPGHDSRLGNLRHQISGIATEAPASRQEFWETDGSRGREPTFLIHSDATVPDTRLRVYESGHWPGGSRHEYPRLEIAALVGP